MEFIVCDRHAIERGIIVRAPYILVSIRDPERRRVRYRRPPALVDVLELAFHDAEPVRGLALPPEIRLMRTEEARSIWKFVQEYRDDVGAVVCHCEQGMSRSPAVAIALAEALGEDSDELRRQFQPNRFVYQMMRRAING